MTGRCLFGHLVIDDSKKCPRCFPDYGGGVEDAHISTDFPKVKRTTPNSLTPVHHSKKNISKGIIHFWVFRWRWIENKEFDYKPVKSKFKGVRYY